MTLRLYRAAEVCEMAELQAYVLRSWEKEFPGIGVQRTPDSPRLYRQADVDQVRRIKQLVFGEGLTVSGARRRLEDSAPQPVSAAEVAEVMSALGSNARVKVERVRSGLRALQSMLSEGPGAFVLQPPPMRVAAKPVARAEAVGTKRGVSSKAATAKTAGKGKPVRTAKPVATKATGSDRRAAPARKTPAAAKRRRASA